VSVLKGLKLRENIHVYSERLVPVLFSHALPEGLCSVAEIVSLALDRGGCFAAPCIGLWIKLIEPTLCLRH
jgi:hypothetical protein